jgi:protein-L-isoaspartate(D-aspartate) O-methyltransferase
VQSIAVTQEPADRLDAALRCVDRLSFCFDVYGVQLPQTSASDMIARMLRLLDVNEGAHVLEIGTGSAFSTALRAQLPAARGAVASVDIDPDMISRAEQLLARAGFEVDLRCGAGQHRWAEHAPYDRAPGDHAVVRSVPAALLDQTIHGAVLVLPMRAGDDHWIARYSRAEARLIEEARLPGGFIPLTPVLFHPWATEQVDSRA